MLRLVLKDHSPIPIEASVIRPDRLFNLSAEEVSQLPILHGNQTRKLGDVFRAIGINNDGEVEVIGDCSKVKSMGQGMTSGELNIFGHVGMHTGSQMRGGKLYVRGDCADWLGAEMRGGLIRIEGDVANHAGGAYTGSLHGMRGGTLLIEGSCGDELGANMRRGLIAVTGKCGNFAGGGMVAGSIVIGGQTGTQLGAGMKRGTIIRLTGGGALPPTFAQSCTTEFPVLHLLFDFLKRHGLKMEFPSGKFGQYRGDLLALGQGEILEPA